MLTRRLFVGSIGALAASHSFAAAPDAPLRVVATTGMIADTARVIGGDRVTVQGLMGAGVDPHAYRQTRSDITAMVRADLVLYHGLYLEAQMESFFEDLSRKRTALAVAQDLPRDVLLAHADYADKFDPHVWMDPNLWQLVVDNIRDALIAARPADADLFRANALAYADQLRDFVRYAETSLNSVPKDARVLVTAHDAFSYFGRAFGYEVMGIQGISTESEAGLNRISALVDILVDRGISAVFVESSVSDRNIRALIEGAAARGHTLRVGGELFSDAMGAPDTYEGTFLGMIDHNFTTITRALGGTAPARGMHGQLAPTETPT